MIRIAQDCIGLYTNLQKPIQDYIGVYRMLWDYIRLYLSLQDLVGFHRIVWENVGLYYIFVQDATDSIGWHRIPQDYAGVYKFLLEFIGVYRILQAVLRVLAAGIVRILKLRNPQDANRILRATLQSPLPVPHDLCCVYRI